MPQVKFVMPWTVKQGDGRGPVYAVGDVVDLPASYAEKYKNRGLAVAVDAKTSAPVVPKPEVEVAPVTPVDLAPAEPPQPNDGPQEMTAAALLDALENDPAMKNFLAFRAQAEKVIGREAMPAKKDEIIAALKALAEADLSGDQANPTDA